jgi:hypothetical protein
MPEPEKDTDHAALQRILREAGSPELLELLSERLAGADLTTLLLEVMRRRASAVSPAEVMRRHSRDRFLAPASVEFGSLRRIQDALLAALPEEVEVLELAPLVPLGTHSALAPVDQNRVVSTFRGTEVAADPTNGLALEAASRRRQLFRTDPVNDRSVRLAAFQRVVRAQRFDDAAAYAHFHLFGLVTAGRDIGNFAFERESAAEHVRFAIEGLLKAGVDGIRIELTDFHPRRERLLGAVRESIPSSPEVRVVDRPDRQAARGYYAGFCFKAFATLRGTTFEVADGGHVEWTQHLLDSRKERLMISGIGLDRLALVASG